MTLNIQLCSVGTWAYSSLSLDTIADGIKSICHRVYEFVLNMIQKIKDCFGPTRVAMTTPGNVQGEATVNTVNNQGPLNLISFYRGGEVNNNGVTLDQILGWDNAQLESVHNYIQWLFPLKNPSPHNPTAPILNAATVQAFRNDPALKTQVLRSFRRMLSFYGLQMNEVSKVISRGPIFNARAADWLINPSGHHNFLRITRMIQSMNILGLSDYTQPFFNIMQDISNNEGNGIISAATLQFWREASRTT